MAKKGPISKIEGFYIEQNYRDMDIAELATDLDRSITSIENHIKKNYTKQKTVTGTTAGDHIVSKRGSTIMTETASTISDAKRQVVRPNTECVTKIKKD
tara:strand:+ start:187 stop:483 length:297 start_codon:yes stop_codon:yes gene_type:complete